MPFENCDGVEPFLPGGEKMLLDVSASWPRSSPEGFAAVWMFRYSNPFRTSVEFSTRPALGSACVHSNTLLPGIAITALHGSSALLFAAQMATMTGPSLPATAGPWMCAAVTLPLSHRANTTPNTVTTGDVCSSPSTRLSVKLPKGFVVAFTAEPVAWLS